jgi:flagellar motor switch protein FliN/FliY
MATPGSANSPDNSATEAHGARVESRDLPPYTRNLLRVKVPVMVTLAQKKQPVRSIVELVPGAIIQFNKSCEEMLELEVSGQPAAFGECVKVGDKFGLRITSMVLPDERFAEVKSC